MSASRRRAAVAAAAGLALALSIALIAPAARAAPTVRDVLVVGDNWDGTATDDAGNDSSRRLVRFRIGG